MEKIIYMNLLSYPYHIKHYYLFIYLYMLKGFRKLVIVLLIFKNTINLIRVVIKYLSSCYSIQPEISTKTWHYIPVLIFAKIELKSHKLDILQEIGITYFPMTLHLCQIKIREAEKKVCKNGKNQEKLMNCGPKLA